MRASIRESVAHRPDAQRALVPALVDGDDGGLDPGLEEDFRTTGLTHLTAVSGTNLTLIVGFLVVLARWGGVRGRWLTLIAAAGIVGFLLLARTEPSVVPTGRRSSRRTRSTHRATSGDCECWRWGAARVACCQRWRAWGLT